CPLALCHHDGSRIAPRTGTHRVARPDADPRILAAGEPGKVNRTRVRKRERLAPRTGIRVERPLPFVTADVPARNGVDTAVHVAGHLPVFQTQVTRRGRRIDE